MRKNPNINIKLNKAGFVRWNIQPISARPSTNLTIESTAGGAQVQIDTIRLLVLLNMRVVTQPE
jgi:hypothetical protein